MHSRRVFLGRALETVVDFELGNVGVDDDLRVLPVGGKDQEALRIGPEDLTLFAIRRGVVDRDNEPSSNNLLLERLLRWGLAGAENDTRAKQRGGR